MAETGMILVCEIKGKHYLDVIHFACTSVLKLNCSKKLNVLLHEVSFLSLTYDQCKEAQLKHCNSIR
jgi:hypothetical protein